MIWISDGSAISKFRENPEAFRLRYRLHLVTQTEDDAPASGTAAHKALDVWFSQSDSDVSGPLAVLRGAWGVEPIFHEGLKRPLTLFERLIEGHAERWPREDDPFEVIGSETYVEGDIDYAENGTFRYCGRRDQKIRFADGGEYIMDNKTTSGWLNDDFFLRMATGEQMPGYVGLELVNGRKCDGYYINALHVDTRYHNVKPEKDFVRFGPVDVRQWQLTQWARDVEYTLREIERLDVERGSDVPWPIYNNARFNKRDEYWDFYTEPPELRESLKLSFAVKEWRPSDA